MQFSAVTLLVSLTFGLLCVPLATHAQGTNTTRRIAVMMTMPSADPTKPNREFAAFVSELRNLGYVDGQNVIIEAGHTAGSGERRRHEVSRLLASKPDVVVGVIVADAEAFREVDSSVPIVLGGAGQDLVEAGLAASLARPGGNVTGIQILQADTAAKRLHMLKELVPHVQSVAVLHVVGNAESPMQARHMPRLLAELETASRALSIRIRNFPVGPDEDLERAYAEMKRDCDALLVVTGPRLTALIPQLVALASVYRLPAIYEYGNWVRSGGLVSYGPNLPANWGRVAHFVDRILKGEKPANIPVEQPRNFELIINLKTARGLNLPVPKHLLLLADRVIE